MTLTEKLSAKTGRDSMIVETYNPYFGHTRYTAWDNIMGADSISFDTLEELEAYIHEYKGETV